MKQIIFIGLNYDQLPYLIELKSMNYFVVGIDKNHDAPGVQLVDKYINLGYDEVEKITDVLSLDRSINPSAVFTAAAQFAHVVAAKIAEMYDLKYPTAHLVKVILDKSKFYNLFSEEKISIPPTMFFEHRDDFLIYLKKQNPNARFYLKSDFSKNPIYVYSGTAAELAEKKVNWERDNFLRSCYILQPEIPGSSLRINIIGSDFEIYDFVTGETYASPDDRLLKIVDNLANFCRRIGIHGWIVKFDIIYDDGKYVALDIGIDPPSRMKKGFIAAGKNFERFYLQRYLASFD